MALIKCSNCGHTVSDRGKKCPKCGTPITKILAIEEVPKERNLKRILAVCVMALIMITLTAASFYTVYSQQQKADSNNPVDDVYEKLIKGEPIEIQWKLEE